MPKPSARKLRLISALKEYPQDWIEEQVAIAKAINTPNTQTAYQTDIEEAYEALFG